MPRHLKRSNGSADTRTPSRPDVGPGRVSDDRDRGEGGDKLGDDALKGCDPGDECQCPHCQMRKEMG